MKHLFAFPLALFFSAYIFAPTTALAGDCNTAFCKEQGGNIHLSSGGTFDLETGAVFTINDVDLTPELSGLNGLTASVADLNATTNFEEVVSATTSELTIKAGKTLDVPTGNLQINNVAITSTAAELNFLDGSVVGNTVASKAALLDANKNLQTNANVGTPGTGVTAVEYGDGYNHVTVLTLTAVALTPTIPADAEGAGAIIYTFPTGVYVGQSAHMDITAGVMDSATNAADLCLGSLIASGDITTCSTAAMEDWVTGQTVADVSTFVKEKSTVMTAGANLLFESSGSHVLNINAAATWNNTVATASVTGTVTIAWTFLGS